MSDSDFLKSVADFRRQRDAKLRSETGWLSLVARWVLEPGQNEIDIGHAVLDHGAVRIVIDRDVQATRDGVAVREHVWDANNDGPGPFLMVGTRRYELLRQSDRVAIRVRDPQSAARTSFHGLDVYPPDERFRVVARLEPSITPKKIALMTGLGSLVEYPSPGTLVFELDGAEQRLDPTVEADAPERLFLLFRDETNADETYQAGRFLYTPMPDAQGRVVVDFNQAYNPPCALTDFASCPLPPPQNRLAVRVTAGEKRFHP